MLFVVWSRIGHRRYLGITPILHRMLASCSADIQAAIVLVDKVFSGQNTTATNLLEDWFGSGGLNYLDYVASARMSPVLVSLTLSSSSSRIAKRVRSPVLHNAWTWQDLQPDSGPNTTSFVFHDAWRQRMESPLPLLGGNRRTLARLGEILQNGHFTRE